MKREIIINARGREARVAIMEDGRLVELMHERDAAQRMVGDLYLGKVEAVLPGIQAAFIDIGTEKSAFLHASDVSEDEDEDENGNGASQPGNRRNRKYPPIQALVERAVADNLAHGQDTLAAESGKNPFVQHMPTLPCCPL